MNIQVLVATMHQKDNLLIKKMNIRTDAIVCNQCNQNKYEEFMINDQCVKFYSFAERGVGLNRNNALMRATGDIVLFADDDMVYVNNYEEIVNDAFKELPQADVIIFNLKEPTKTRYVITKKRRVGRLNYLRYGTARIAVRLSSIKINGIFFNQCFGGGTEYSHGEDNLFLTACLDKGLKIFSYPAIIANLTEERESSWNQGYTEKYFKDQGILYHCISKRFWRFLCLQDAIRHQKMYGKKWHVVYRLMTNNQT